ncbi:MAG: hypothetical protein QFB86_03520 [Patescibacteria group bacterium]|nr:hypothetical protein [Patescibacteria group bacterium]
MSEQQPHMNPEHHEFKLDSKEDLEHMLPDAEHAEALRAGERDPVEALIEARSTVAETAHEDAGKAVAESLKAAEGAGQTAPPQEINRELKSITLRRELNGIQRKLPAPKRALSKVVHQPVVRVASEAVGSTVSRPSGLLGGSIVAFIGTSAYLYLAKHLGFEYNFVVFLLLFTGGYIIGLLIELIVHLATASRRNALNT